MFIGKLDIFPLMCAAGSLNWPWSTKILGQSVTRMCKNWLWYWKLSVSVSSNTFWCHWLKQ